MSRMRLKVKTCDVYIFTSSSVRAACDIRSRPPMCTYLPLRSYEQDATQGQDLRCVHIYLFVRMSRMRHKVKTCDVYIFTSSSVRAGCDTRSRPAMCIYLRLRPYEQDATQGQDLRCVYIYLFVRKSSMRYKVKTSDVYIFTSSFV